MEDIRTEKPARYQFQHRLSLLLLAVLALIAVCVVWVQGRYETAAWREQAATPSQPPDGGRADTEGVTPLSPAERYLTDTLSDKINGKADLYLGAGFKELASRRFALTVDNARWLERYVYDMGGFRNAFSVYSVQRRTDARAVDVTPHAYLSSNGLFMVHGPYYVEIIASEASEAMQAQLTALAKAFVETRAVETSRLAELDLFGPDNLVPGSSKLIADSAFGIQGLNWVYTAEYAEADARATAFITRREQSDRASDLAASFIAFWNEYGAEPIDPPNDLPSARIAFILDNYEIAMVHGPYVYGVHEASSRDFGLKVVRQLQRAIEEISR